MRARSTLPLAFAAMFVCSSCSPPQYFFAPVTTTGADIAGIAAASSGLPPEKPRGELRVASFGIAPFDGTAQRALYLRVEVSNHDDTSQSWTIDASEQRVDLEGERTALAPAPLRGARPTVIEVRPGATTTLGLFFPLPLGLRDAKEIPEFDVTWTVHLGVRIVRGRARFERFMVDVRPVTPFDIGSPRESTFTETTTPTWQPRRPMPP
jgi:hypothetical protein